MESSPAYAMFVEQTRQEIDSWPRHKRYEFEIEAARGGTSTVWRAFDAQLGRYVAVKVLLPSYDCVQMRSRLEQEALICARLDHAGVVPVLDFDRLMDGRPFIAMRWIEGNTLSVVLDKSPKFDRSKLSIFRRLCEVMRHAHDRNVIHRDLKPANVFVDRYDEVHIVDWGLAKYIGAEESVIADNMPTGTNIDTIHGSVMGTPSYMSPEQAKGESVLIDKRSDVFALGCILFRMLTGEHVYTGSSHTAIFQDAVVANVRPSIAKLRSVRANKALKKIAIACLSPMQAKRPKDAGAVFKLLERVGAPNRFLSLMIIAFFVVIGLITIEAIYVYFFGIVELRYD